MERDFKGIWIPKEIWLDYRLSMLDKAILMEIDSLDSGEDGCYASNKHIAEFCQCSERKVSESINKLIEIGFLMNVGFDGKTRRLKSSLEKIARVEKIASLPSKNCEYASQKLLHSNIKENNKREYKEKNIKEKKAFSPPTLEEVKAYCQERKNHVDPERFIDYYTSKGWLVGKTKMKDWKASVRTWERSEYNKKDDTPKASSFEVPKELAPSVITFKKGN